jgi:hypothetical protein
MSIFSDTILGKDQCDDKQSTNVNKIRVIFMSYSKHFLSLLICFLVVLFIPISALTHEVKVRACAYEDGTGWEGKNKLPGEFTVEIFFCDRNRTKMWMTPVGRDKIRGVRYMLDSNKKVACNPSSTGWDTYDVAFRPTYIEMKVWENDYKSRSSYDKCRFRCNSDDMVGSDNVGGIVSGYRQFNKGNSWVKVYWSW